MRTGGEPKTAVHHALARADAGVIVLSPRELVSAWVAEEAGILIWRHEVSSAFPLIPVLVDLDASELPPGPPFSSLAELEVLSGQPEAVARTIVEILTRSLLAGEKDEPTDPLDTHFLSGDRPFIDRAALRQCLRRLMADRAFTLVVTGPRGSGKTLTSEYIAFVADRTQAFKVLTVSLDTIGGASISPAGLAQALVQPLRVSTDSMPRTSEHGPRFTLELANWVLTVMTRSRDVWWWVLDGFSSSGAPVETLDFIIQLVTGIETGVARVRLVLLDFDRPLPADIAPFVEREAVQPINEREISGFLGAFLASRDRDTAVKAILKGIPDDEARLALVAQRVNQVLGSSLDSRRAARG